ncbi:COMM domain-containing protein 9-like [Oscarella lobularis]|uniref:COMM domain-containing protein 9-like n=1 Tax=Oscarella lobularis TaxID=121494 RepID=UPI0033138803
MDADSLAPLNLLLKAKSKEAVLSLFQEAFQHRNETKFPNVLIASVAEDFDVEQVHVAELIKALALIINHCLYNSISEPRAIFALFPDSFHKNLRELISKILADNVSGWSDRAIKTQVSLPQLQDFDWRVDIKSSADSMARMSVPTCIVQMKVQKQAERVDQIPSIENVNIEFTKETLDTMLDGLGKIRDQLSSVAGRQS